MKKAIDSATFIALIDKLPHSKSRVPYTYHHDYLRQKLKMHNGMSRSQVSILSTDDDVELHAIALTQLLDELGSKAIYHISPEDVYVCKKAKDITDAAIDRYNSEHEDNEKKTNRTKVCEIRPQYSNTWQAYLKPPQVTDIQN